MAETSVTPARKAAWLTPALFTATIFLSASLLFFVQPLFTKVVLPHVGGAPAVWTTAMLFFQSVLIAGYLYAHLITRHLSVRAQIAVHLGLWAVALIFLPLAVAEGWRYDAEKSTAVQTLILFAGGVGLPFAVLSANAPLIQSWYSRSGGYSADDPYFLYGASNLGSLIALLAFPLVAEPFFGATQIGWAWTVGFWALGALLLFSGLRAYGRVAQTNAIPKSSDAPSLSTRLYWGLIAFVPSSLMLAVTTKLSTDLGSVPLVWVIPLALFLLTFVLVFTNRPIASLNVLRVGYLVGLATLAGLFSNLFGYHITVNTAVLLIVAFFVVGLYAHALLYATRPASEHLTTFYVTMSIGGALGGFFNSIVAPALFTQLHEGPITVAVAALLLLDPKVGLSRAGMVLLAILFGVMAAQQQIAALLGLTGFALVAAMLLVGLATKMRAAKQVQTFVLLAALVLGQTLTHHGAPVFSDRSFFGTHTVVDHDGLRFYINGTTTHGAQRLADMEAEQPEPQSYYHRNGPMAQVVTSATGDAAETIGIVGLGIGAMACYGQPHQNWHFYEIDALVDEIARNPDYFTFMSQCAADAPTHLGDARVVLAEQSDLKYDILIMDAYSSDSVPVHLTTLEAVEMYFDRLHENGLLLFHISNRYYAIDKPLGRIAEALGLEARIQTYQGNMSEDFGNLSSVVVAMARNEAALGITGTDPRWEKLRSDGGRVWTDDFANVLEILHSLSH